MKQLILCIALIMSATGNLYAQFEYTEQEARKTRELSPTEQRFNAPSWHDIRDYAYVKGGIIIYELNNLKDYDVLKGIDTILQQLKADIGFYTDSLENGSDNVRIDYAISIGENHKEMRFIKHKHPGNTFVKINGTTDKLKIEMDTIRLVINNIKYENIGRKGKSFKYSHPAQITILLNNYIDIGSLIAQKELLQKGIDTFISVRTRNESNNPFRYPSSCIYRPTDTSKRGMKYRFVKRDYIPSEFSITKLFEEYIRYRKFAFYGNVGMGVVRNTLVPNADIGITHLSHPRRGYPTEYDFVSLYASPYFFFERGSNREQYVHNNWFVNIEAGGTYDKEFLGVKIKSISLGGGYLALAEGDHFKATTVKVFMGVRMPGGLSLYPEVIATNNFKQIFPGMTLKIFGFKRES